MDIETKPTLWGDLDVVCEASRTLCSVPTLADLSKHIGAIRLLKDVQRYGRASLFTRTFTWVNTTNIAMSGGVDERGVREVHLALDSRYWDTRTSF